MHPRTEALQLFRYFLATFRIAVHDHRYPTFAGTRTRDRGADTLAAAGDDDGFVFEV
jgi:hypothetical protein